MAKTNAQKQRAMRQEELRELLSKQKLVEKVIDNTRKIEELDESDELFSNKLNKLKTANEQRFRLISKYLPDLKQQEISMEVKEITDAAELTDSQLARIASECSQGAAEEEGSKEEPNRVH